MNIFFRRYISEFVYGAVDGTVTTFAVVAASAGAGISSVVILILGIANLIADGFSMGASAPTWQPALSTKDQPAIPKSEPLLKSLAQLRFWPLLPWVACQYCHT